jgi:hypothetical protein
MRNVRVIAFQLWLVLLSSFSADDSLGSRCKHDRNLYYEFERNLLHDRDVV